MSTLTGMVLDYHKKNNISYNSKVYTHIYKDGSIQDFIIESSEKEVALYDHEDKEWYDVTVMTKQFSVFVHTDMFSRLDWFDGKKFRSINSAIKAIKKDILE